MEVFMDYRTPIGVFKKVILEKEPAVRMVLTGRCNLACEFCIYKKENFNSSEVESKELVDMVFSKELLDTCMYLKNEFQYNIIHLTGGEPTLCNDIYQIAKGLKDNNFKVNMVTNLTNIDVLMKMYEKNLIDELTFSYIPNDKEESLRQETLMNYKTTDNDRSRKVKENALFLRKRYNAIIKTNIICSGFTDIKDAICFIRWCHENGIRPRLQRDRSNDRIDGSTETVMHILKEMRMKPDMVVIRVPGATEILKFKDDLGNSINFKVFNQNFRFDSICNHCYKVYECDKALSSIRIFNKKEGPVLCFCNKLDETFTSLNYSVFAKSSTINEITALRENMELYFDKYCTLSNHQ